jgi:hypothetical protein
LLELSWGVRLAGPEKSHCGIASLDQLVFPHEVPVAARGQCLLTFGTPGVHNRPLELG